MRTSYALNHYMDEAAAKMRRISHEARSLSVNGTLMLQDYPFWLYHAIFADYSTISFLAKCMSDIDYFDLRPLYCILRSSLEKYADLANLCAKGRTYEWYLWYLNFESNAMEAYTAGDSREGASLRRKADSYKRQFMERWEISRCNRLTRYYVLGDFNQLIQGSVSPDIVQFNRSLSKIDSKCSQILHNNVTFAARHNREEIKDILTYIHYIMWTSQWMLPRFYSWNLPELQEGLAQLQQAIDCIHQGKGFME